MKSRCVIRCRLAAWFKLANRLNKLANLSDWIEPSWFCLFPPSAMKNTTDGLLSPLSSSAPPPNCSIPIQLGFISPRCAFPSKDSTSFFYSLSSSSSSSPQLASSFRSKWYLMCKEERRWINNQSSPSLCPKASGFSLLSRHWGSFIVYKKHR